MKRIDLLRHIEAHNCRLVREGGNHTVYLNALTRKITAIPRHREINEFLAVKICKDLDIPSPKA
ncbi:MAG: type II toxin-antitoxin system HicA family toxin [Methylococcaceae bacterium]